MSSTLRIGRLAGIPIGIRPPWLLVVALITYSLGHDYDGVDDPALTAVPLAAAGALRLGLGGGAAEWLRDFVDHGTGLQRRLRAGEPGA